MNSFCALTRDQKQELEELEVEKHLQKTKDQIKDLQKTMELGNMLHKLKSFHGEGGRRDAWAARRGRIVETLYLSGADVICL
jgi:hypothetical protein